MKWTELMGSDDVVRAERASLAIEMEMAHAIIWLRFCREATGVLENAFRAGVMDELLSPDQSLDHDDLAPGTKAIGQLNSRHV
ncbi:MAG: hypothetical protein HP495_03260 [Nitrospira sp.]|nr:hypothetical protein [Nitrospira sp.]